MQTNLTDGYVQFIEEGNSLTHLVQELIDRAQYVPNFINILQDALDVSESPFETVTTNDGPIRRIKSSFVKSESNEQASITEPTSGDSGNKSI